MRAALLFWVVASCCLSDVPQLSFAQRAPAPAPGATANLTQGLANFAARFPSFSSLASQGNWRGWEDLSEDPCGGRGANAQPWTNLQCTNGVLTGINFTDMKLSGNLDGVQWQNFPDVTTLVLYNCNLSGSLPVDLATQLPGLKAINMGYNRFGDQSDTGFEGSLPAGWGSFTQIESLFIAGNRLNGSIPNTWGSWRRLQSTSMDNNALTGPLNSSWPQTMPQVNGLWMFANQLSGTVPPEWGSFGNLSYLSLGINNLNGTLPPELANLTQAVVMQISDNGLTGTLPAAWGENSTLLDNRGVMISGNDLTGPIPSTWAGTSSSRRSAILKPDNQGLCGTQRFFDALSSTDAGNTRNEVELPACPSPPPPPSAPPPPPIVIPSATPATQAASASSSSLSGGGIAGIVIGVVVALALVGLALFMWRRRRRTQDPFNEKQRAFITNSSGTWTGTTSGNSLRSPSASFHDSALDWFMAEAKRGAPSGKSQPRGGSQRGAEAEGDFEFAWQVEPYRLEVCHHPDGRPWRLGQGGYGTVYKARLDGVTDVAIKFLKPEAHGLNSGDGAGRFFAEVNVLRAARNKYILMFMGAWLHEECAYMVSEYLPHGDLYSALTDPRMVDIVAWKERGRQMCLDVAQGLFYLHSNSVVHLDIKSPNILLDEHFNAKIADTGLARTLFSKTHLSSTPGGTYTWQAPETLLGLPSSYSADIWSFGVVMLEIITLERQTRGQYSTPRREQCSAEIAELVRACMSSEPAGRPSAREVILRIQQSPP